MARHIRRPREGAPPVKRRLALIPLALLALTACSVSTARSRCLDDGKVILFADPTDDDSDMIACVSIEQYQSMLDSQAMIEANIEPSDIRIDD